MSLCLQYVQLHPLVFPVFVNHACEFVPVQQVPTVPFQSPISLVLSHTLPSYHSLSISKRAVFSFSSISKRAVFSFSSISKRAFRSVSSNSNLAFLSASSNRNLFSSISKRDLLS